MPKQPTVNLRAVDLFCGCGGLSLGFQEAGFEVLASFDCWKPAVEVYKANFKHPIHELELAALHVRISPVRAIGMKVLVGLTLLTPFAISSSNVCRVIL